MNSVNCAHWRQAQLFTLIAALVLLHVFFTPNFVYAQIPRVISYQGEITNSDGTPVADGLHTLTLSLYRANSTTAIYTESQSVTITKGLFNVLIGSVQPLPATVTFSEQYYLGLSIDKGPELPKTQLAASPYALHATMADSLAMPIKGVVTSLNGVGGALTLEGGGSTTVTNSGGVLTISSTGSGGTGMQGMKNVDGSVVIVNPNGPTATVSVATDGITTAKIANSAVTGAKIAQSGATVGQVLKWDGVSWTPAMDLGLLLPNTFTVNTATDALDIINNGSGAAIVGVNGGTGKAATFRQSAAAGSAEALYVESDATGAALHAVATGGGRSGYFERGNLEIGGAGASLVLSGLVAAPAGPFIQIPGGLSIFRIAFTPGNQANALNGPPGATQGQILYIVNDDDDAATLGGSTVASGATRQFIFIGGAWRIVG